jgi:uncharacterized membrane protein
VDRSNFAGIAIIIVTYFLVFFLEKSTYPLVRNIKKWIPSILFAFIFPALLVHLLSLDFSGSDLFSWNTRYLYPFTIFTIMSSMSLKALRIVWPKPLLLFLLGSMTIATIPVVLVIGSLTLGTGATEALVSKSLWKGFIPIVGSWIGGSSSMVILKAYAGIGESLFLSVLVIDTIIQNIVMILLFQSIRRTDYLNQKFRLDELRLIEVPANADKSHKYLSIAFSIAVPCIFILCNVSFLTHVLALSCLGLFFGNALRFWDHKINLQIGSVGIILIMAVIGLKLDFGNFELPLVFVGTAAIWMLLNIVVVASFGCWLKTSFAWTPIVLMANIGGVSTAPALAMAYDKRLMPHAVILAILSMATGTFWGILTYHLIYWIISI